METGLNSCFIVRFEFHNKFELKKLEQFQKDHSPESDEEDGCDAKV